MLFNSYIFLFIFLPFTWILFRFACAKRILDVALALLMVASLVFYSYWNPPFVFLILFSILFNYSWGRLIEKASGRFRTLWLFSGVAVNLLLIAYFKYANFMMTNIAWFFGWEWTARDIFLPLGISFFTFQQIAYLIDCAKGLAKEHAFTHYALFVTFFPQLIAGPIVRYEEIMPQFARLRTFAMNYRNIAMGLALLSLGLFKKVVIADTLSPWVAAAFDTRDPLTFFEAWGGVLSYTFQIYFDFSGYSDMALGLGRLFNIELPINFNSPYKALSISDFWRRWHMTLSSFLRDYLYIPLGGNRQGKIRRNVNLMTTMLLGGLWHGASWNFVVWGGLHGVFLVINHAYRKLLSSLKITPPPYITADTLGCNLHLRHVRMGLFQVDLIHPVMGDTLRHDRRQRRSAPAELGTFCPAARHNDFARRGDCSSPHMVVDRRKKPDFFTGCMHVGGRFPSEQL